MRLLRHKAFALWALLLAALHLCAGQTIPTVGDVVGDECDSGRDFPLRFGPVEFVGCTESAGAKWCVRADSTMELCPDFSVVDDLAKSLEEISPDRKILTSDGPTIVITEMMIVNDDEGVVDEDGESADWIELFNASDEDIDLEGWHLTDNADESNKWELPSLVMSPGDYVLIVASGKDRISDTAAHTNFKLSSSGEFLGIFRPDGSISCAIDGEYPHQFVNVAYGIPEFDESDDIEDQVYTFLEEATPGDSNSERRKTGPYIAGLHHTFEGGPIPEGVDFIVTVALAQNIGEPEEAELTYRIMFEDEVTIPMETEDGVVFSATIPASELSAGQLVRYYVTAIDSDGLESREPFYLNDDWPEFYGTVVRDPELESSRVPTLYWFSSDPEQSTSEEGFQSTVFYRGKLYDNVFTRRRGITALTWPKPKLKFDFKGTVFKMKKGMPDVEEFNLQSFWDEPGEDSYMREPLAFQVMREAGVPASEVFHVRVNLNGEYYGLFAFVEQVDDTFLQKHDMDVSGPLFKSSHGELSNLRWDLKLKDIPWAYRKGNRPGVDDSEALHNLIVSLGGGGDLPRSKFLYDHVNLPEVINYMAVNNMLLNQDRCTKNFYSYMHPYTKQWTIIPWDLEAAFGISNGLNGNPAPDYCILACEQWNSPLYCDSQHPQDLVGITNLQIKTGRRLAFFPTETPRQVSYKLPTESDYDEDRTTTTSPIGAPGTYNHLDDAILSWGPTREMYLRRLRTLIDQFLDGRVQEIIKDMWTNIRGEAAKDNAKWDVTNGATVGSGYKQLLTEQLPKRKDQLLNVYGPDGIGLIPESQPEDVELEIIVESDEYITVTNPNDFAVDISQWQLVGGTTFTFQSGTVVPSDSSLYVAPDIVAFRNREKSPKGGEGLLVVGPCSGITGADIGLLNSSGQAVVET